MPKKKIEKKEVKQELKSIKEQSSSSLTKNSIEKKSDQIKSSYSDDWSEPLKPSSYSFTQPLDDHFDLLDD